jgi:hypothetical protein
MTIQASSIVFRPVKAGKADFRRFKNINAPVDLAVAELPLFLPFTLSGSRGLPFGARTINCNKEFKDVIFYAWVTTQ